MTFNRKTRGLLLALTALTSAGCGEERADPSTYPVIPIPREIEAKRGSFTLDEGTRIVVSSADDPGVEAVVERWAIGARAITSLPLPIAVGEDDRSGNAVHVRVDAGGRSGGRSVPAGEGLPGITAESYELDVTRHGITLAAAGAPGVFYGLETLGQIIPAGMGEGPRALTLPAVEIDDAPRFRYRGMHLDVGRHFFPVDFVKRYLDFLAAYKMNVFHWHLTEDQGWRIEILGYPRLTQVGSCRAETMVAKNFDPFVGDGTPHCGFYTQAEIREVVAYARERFITVIPEIEMPGHSVAALAAYPELACTSGPFEVATRWGVTRDIFCPKEETFAFLEGVLTEVMGLFPGPYVHIGGDEAPKAAWENSDLAQEVIRREGLADEEELQSWFIRRIESFLNANGRDLVGWDEILEGGLAPNATVMSWRGMAGGTEAAREGHDVIMTPNSHVYLDHYQGDTIQEPLAIGGFSPLERVYAFEPVPPELTDREAAHVLGGQGNVWTEYIATTEYVEYMVLPRMLALSEVVWSPRESREWESFIARLPAHLARLDRMGASYRVPDVSGLEGDRLTLEDWASLALSAPAAGKIHYTLDGSDPGPDSPEFTNPLSLALDRQGIEVAARVVLPDGRGGAVRRARIRRVELAGAVDLPRSSRAQGLVSRIFPGNFLSVDSLPVPVTPGPSGGAPGEVPRVTLPQGAPPQRFGLLLEGFVRVPGNGVYTLFLSSDDGSRLTIAGEAVVDHDGYHGMTEKRGQAALRRGWHPIEVRFFQGGGGAGLKLEIEGPGVDRRDVPAHWLAHPIGPSSPME